MFEAFIRPFRLLLMCIVVNVSNLITSTKGRLPSLFLTLYGHIKTAVQRTIFGGAWAGSGPAQSPHRYTKCNSPPINGQCIPTLYHSTWHYNCMCTLRVKRTAELHQELKAIDSLLSQSYTCPFTDIDIIFLSEQIKMMMMKDDDCRQTGLKQRLQVVLSYRCVFIG